MHLAGPFVDYLCSNEITMTSTLPVMIDGRFAGVVCADVLVSSLEDLLLPLVSQLPNPAFVNSSGRVVVSSDSNYETGDRFPLGGETTRSAKYPFALATAA